MPITSRGPEPARLPSLLVSYVNLAAFRRNRHLAGFRSWVLDSGAYSALTSGAVIDLGRFTADALELQETDPTLEAIFALDVIGDPERSIRNAETMIAAGMRAIPTFHHGSPMHYLADVARLGDRIALGGMVQRGAGGHGTALQYPQRLDFLNRCYASIWPKWVHGFGVADERIYSRVPLSSVDSTTWYYAQARYGSLIGVGRKICPSRSRNPGAFRSAALRHIDLCSRAEARASEAWRARLAPTGLAGPEVRLATSGVAAEMRLLGEYAALIGRPVPQPPSG